MKQLILICLLVAIVACKHTETVTVTGHNGDHEVLLSNGRSILVENAYSEAYVVGTTLIFK